MTTRAHRRPSCRLAATLLAAAAWHAGANAQEPEFVVNEHTTKGLQLAPDVASAPDGSFAISWASEDGANFSQAWLRRYGADLAADADEARVDDESGPAFTPVVARNGEGDIAVAWWAFDGFAIRGIRLAGDGTPVGATFTASNPPFVGLTQIGGPAIAGIFLDQFVVTWPGTHDFIRYDVFGRRIDAGGVPIGQGFTANGDSSSDHTQVTVAADAQGNYLVAWHVGTRILARRFTAAGVSGPPFEVAASGASSGIALAGDADGVFVAVWPQGDTILARRFGPDAQPLEAAFRVDTSGSASLPDVATGPDGGFTVAWQKSVVAFSDADILLRRFDPDADALGGEVRVDQPAAGFQADPAIAALGERTVVVAWSSKPPASDDGDIVARVMVDPTVFGDGFEP